MSETEGLRKSQAQVLAYQGGQMGVAAVPGAGKTFTLSRLAASLVEQLSGEGDLDEQEVLVVTLTNSAVNNFRGRIAGLLKRERGLLPYVGYRVRTLHGLAHDIVRMRPALAGLAEGFDILDERVTSSIRHELAENWIRLYGDHLIPYLGGSLEMADESGQQTYFLRQQGPDLIEGIASEIIRLAKDRDWDPDEMRAKLDESPRDLLLARIGIETYEGYQRSLRYRGAVDFDDLIRLAMQALNTDPDFLERLRRQWPYILEDEAQDSSLSQDSMLKLLSAGRNWVRVGDPNQSIFTTFTTANANILRRFIADEAQVRSHPLPESGRSSRAIIALANELVRWSRTSTLIPHLHDTFFAQDISPTPPGDPQPNPNDGLIHIDYEPDKNITPEKEIERMVKSIERWLPEHPGWTVAVLTPENMRGFKVAEALAEKNIPYEELLRSTSATRDAAAKLQLVFEFLAEPGNARHLATLFVEVCWRLYGGDPEDEPAVALRDALGRALRTMRNTEDFLWPGPEGGWLPERDEAPEVEALDLLDRFRADAQDWLEATLLPVDQLALTVAARLFNSQADLALSHKIAVVLKGIAAANPDYRLPELTQELRVIAQNERRFLGFDDADKGFEPKQGVVTIATMHAAKGLEWDRVYLLSVNNYSFPAGLPGDTYVSERWFIRDELNMQAEARAQAIALMEGRPGDYVEGVASKQARIDYAQERLRLLYVAITRARRDLVLMWNMGRFWEQGRRAAPAQALLALYEYWLKERKSDG